MIHNPVLRGLPETRPPLPHRSRVRRGGAAAPGARLGRGRAGVVRARRGAGRPVPRDRPRTARARPVGRPRRGQHADGDGRRPRRAAPGTWVPGRRSPWATPWAARSSTCSRSVIRSSSARSSPSIRLTARTGRKWRGFPPGSRSTGNAGRVPRPSSSPAPSRQALRPDCVRHMSARCPAPRMTSSPRRTRACTPTPARSASARTAGAYLRLRTQPRSPYGPRRKQPPGNAAPCMSPTARSACSPRLSDLTLVQGGGWTAGVGGALRDARPCRGPLVSRRGGGPRPPSRGPRGGRCAVCRRAR